MPIGMLLEKIAGKKAIIYFIFDGNEETMKKTILHEIAHYVLSHEGSTSPTGDPAEEKEAKDLVNKWMNPP